MMNQIILDLPSDTLLALKVQPEMAGDALRMAAAVKFIDEQILYYEVQMWSSHPHFDFLLSDDQASGHNDWEIALSIAMT